MKKLFAAIILGISTTLFAATPINGIVAVVNSGIVTQSQLDNAINFEKMRISTAGIPMPTDQILRKQALNSLVIQTAALQMAKKNNITVSNSQIMNTINMVAEANHSPVQALYKHMQSFGISEADYKASVKNSLIIRSLEQKAIASNIMVTPDEISNYLATNAKSKAPNTKYKLAHILIALPASPTPADIQKAQTKANMVYSKIENGMSFKAAAAQYSDASDASKGGVLGFEPLSLLPNLFVKPAQTLSTNSVSKPFKSPTGFHIVKLLAKEKGSSQKHFVTQYQLQQILIKVSPVTSSDRAETILRNLRTALLNGKSFSKLARENSQDPITAANGGKTAWEDTASMDRVTAGVVSRLKPNQISQPFKTPDGWMLVKLLGSRKHDNTANYEREMAANAIFQKKAMEAVNTWRAQLKGESYIKIFDENA